VAATLVNGKSDNFNVTNTLTATVDGADSHTFNAGDTINFADGMNVTTSSDITKYSATAPESYNVTVGTTDAYTATVKTAANGAVAGAQTVTVDATNGGSYNLGNGVDFTLAAGTLAGAASHNFTVADTTQTNATLTNTTTNTTVATKTVNGAETIDFGSGLTVAAADKTNGNATFSISGSVEDDSLKMQIGANNGQTMNIDVNDMRSLALGISSATSGATKSVTDSMGNTVNASYTTIKDVTNGTNNSNAEFALDVSTADKATAAISVLDSAISNVSAERSKLGAVQNRLEHTINNLGTASQNLTSAQSRIADVDMAKEMSEFSKNNILSQAAQAMLAQANQQPQQVLQLLR
jgi:flagellin